MKRSLLTEHAAWCTPLLLAATSAMVGLGCGDSAKATPPGTLTGQSEFKSAPANATSSNGSQTSGGAVDMAEAVPTAAVAGSGADKGSAVVTRTVEETDIYRFDPATQRLYFLNAYRGLMVFDVSDVDNPRFLGRSPIYGSPVEMVVRGGIAIVVVADWYGAMDNGTPFHGSIVRGIDATDPQQMRILGEAKLGGAVRDTRVVGDVLYAVSEEYSSNYYGWGSGYATTDGVAVGGSTGPSAVISAVSFANGVIAEKGRYAPAGSNSVFNVTANAILFVHNVANQNADGYYTYDSSRTAIDYIDISSPDGQISPRGHLEFAGYLSWGGADNGRWNVDFADGKTAHVLACGQSWCGGTDGSLVLATADFANPDAPAMASLVSLPSSGWSPTARFDAGRMYLSSNDSGGCYYGSGTPCSTPIQVVDLSDSKAPKIAGSTSITGQVWLFMPAGNRLFALGNDYDPSLSTYNSQISLRYLDVSNAAQPSVLGTAKFGENWAWTPANGTFKAFIKDDAQGLVVLPFSGWSSKDDQYNNGVQLIEFTQASIAAAGAAHTKGWVERGIFVKDASGKTRIVSLSDQALAVVDYADKTQPRVVKELTLARNVVDARPLVDTPTLGDQVAALSTDWWWANDQDHAELRVLPVSTVDEVTTMAETSRLDLEGTNARIFHNGSLSYAVTNLRRQIACPDPTSTSGKTMAPSNPDGETGMCLEWFQRVQVIDFSTGAAVKRGAVDLPAFGAIWDGGWGWGGCYYYDWYWGDSTVQIGGSALAFNRFHYNYDTTGEYRDALRSLFVVDLTDPDAPSVSSTNIITGDRDWWGDLRAVGDKLYTTHYEWLPREATDTGPDYVRYYLDIVDLSNRKNPVIGQKINVPGVFVGASESDPSIIYTIDYRWWSDRSVNDLAALKLDIVGSKAYLQGRLEIPGSVGGTFIRGNRAYMTASVWDDEASTSHQQLWQVDLSDPAHPIATQTAAKEGWGWLVGVEGDRAFVTSGWSNQGIDIYRLGEQTPVFDQTVRTLGWGSSSLSRKGDTVFLASGYWGVQKINLNQ